MLIHALVLVLAALALAPRALLVLFPLVRRAFLTTLALAPLARLVFLAALVLVLPVLYRALPLSSLLRPPRRLLQELAAAAL